MDVCPIWCGDDPRGLGTYDTRNGKRANLTHTGIAFEIALHLWRSLGHLAVVSTSLLSVIDQDLTSSVWERPWNSLEETGARKRRMIPKTKWEEAPST